MTKTTRLTPELYLAIRQRLLAIDGASKAIAFAAERIERTQKLFGIEGTKIEDILWHNFGDKPLFSAMRANEGGLGDRYAHMWKNRMFPSWSIMAKSDWEISVRKKNNKNGKVVDEYFGVGVDAVEFNTKAGTQMDPVMEAYPQNKRPRVAYMRLSKMRTIAINIPTATPIVPVTSSLFFTSKTGADFLVAGKSLGNALGIGLTTAYHGAADMGFQVMKPDIHVTRTLGYFKNIDDYKAFDDPGGFLGSDKNKAEVVCAGVTLARQINPKSLLPEFCGNAFREVDIVLMQASLHDINKEFK